MSPDPWTTFLDWLSTILAPAWGELIALLPFFVLIGIVGPIISIIALLWLWYLLHRTRGHVGHEEAQAVPAPRLEDGSTVFAPNVPYCEVHALVYPPQTLECEIDREDLSVVCPVDGTVRSAAVQICPGCGTRYILGATASPVVVSNSGGPPEGGAAVA
ncbi:MAG: hypothetical protein ACC726_02765 [Chloroflexota bacterium]